MALAAMAAAAAVGEESAAERAAAVGIVAMMARARLLLSGRTPFYCWSWSYGWPTSGAAPSVKEAAREKEAVHMCRMAAQGGGRSAWPEQGADGGRAVKTVSLGGAEGMADGGATARARVAMVATAKETTVVGVVITIVVMTIVVRERAERVAKAVATTPMVAEGKSPRRISCNCPPPRRARTDPYERIVVLCRE